MSRAGVLDHHTVVDDDEWIYVASPVDEHPKLAGAPVLEAIFAAQSALSRGIYGEVIVDTDDLSELDELDDAAIRAFLTEND